MVVFVIEGSVGVVPVEKLVGFGFFFLLHVIDSIVRRVVVEPLCPVGGEKGSSFPPLSTLVLRGTGWGFEEFAIPRESWPKKGDDWSCHAFGEYVGDIVFSVHSSWACDPSFYAFFCVVVVLYDEFISWRNEVLSCIECSIVVVT